MANPNIAALSRTGHHGQASDVASLLARIDGGTLAAVAAPVHASTGFEPLDRVLGGGLRLHDLTVLGGRPAVGKTIVALQWARQLALQGIPVVYACYEHDEHTLLSRLLALEIGELGLDGRRNGDEIEIAYVLSEVAAGRWMQSSPAGRHPIVRAARSVLESYGESLVLLRASASKTGLAQLRDIVSGLDGDHRVLVVDYLQKVPSFNDSGDRVTSVAAGLKQIALDLPVSVVTIAAADAHSLASRRLYLHSLESATALGYEADVVIMLNDKRMVLSKSHLSFESAQVDRVRRLVVFSVEKNRGGIGLIDVEFEKDFAHYRFHPQGAYVAERLVDNVIELD